MLLPPFGSKEGDTFTACGGGGDRYSDTLYNDNYKVLPNPTYLVSGEGGSAVLYEFRLTAAPVLFIPLFIKTVNIRVDLSLLCMYASVSRKRSLWSSETKIGGVGAQRPILRGYDP